jgi:protease-4
VRVVPGWFDWIRLVSRVGLALLTLLLLVGVVAAPTETVTEEWLDARFQPASAPSPEEDITTIGLVDLQGMILSEDVPAGIGTLADEVVITPDLVRDALYTLVDRGDIDGILLRISTPGGTVAASDEIAHVVRLVNQSVPVYVYSSDLLASGGYYLSAGATKIYSHKQAMVGSIGVIAQIPNVESLLRDKLGVQMETYKAGALKDMEDGSRSRTPEERALIQADVNEAYDTFIQVVREGRRLNDDRVRELATGRVWSGQRAKELGLVDDVTYQEDLAGLLAREFEAPTREVRFVRTVWPSSFFDEVLATVQTTMRGPSLLAPVDQVLRVLPAGLYYLHS